MQSPSITTTHVQAALDSMLYASAAPVANPLQRLIAVDGLLADPDRSTAARARDLALAELIVSAIRDGLSFQRATFEMAVPDERVNRAQAIEHLRADGLRGSPELIGWSLLFFRYVCVNLDFSVEALADALSVDSRTVRRYQQHSVRRLTDVLTDIERTARAKQRVRRLVAQLPMQSPLSLIGRAPVFATFDMILERSSPRHIYLSGAHGSGKTAVVQEYLRRLITNDGVDQLIWVDEPASAQQIFDAVRARLVPEESRIAVREIVQLQRVAVVLDGIDALAVSIETTLLPALGELSGALVFLIAAGYIALQAPHVHVALSELDEAETVALVSETLAGSDEDAETIQAFGAAVWHAVGGNPLLARLTAASHQFFDTLATVDADTLDRVYGRAYAALDRMQKRVWAKVTLFPPGEIGLTQLADLWPSDSPAETIEQLISRHALETLSRERGSFALNAAARRFLRARFPVDAELRGLIGELLNELDWHSPADATLRNVLLYLLEQEWPPAPETWRQRALHRLAEMDVPTRQRTRWRVLLERERARSGTLDAPLTIAYAVSLRRAAEWTVAVDMLADLIRTTGNAGEFFVQARAMLELAVVYRYQSDYERSQQLLMKVERAARRFRADDLLAGAVLELAQIEVDGQNGADALRLLEGLPDSARGLALRAEALMQVGEFVEGVRLIDHALKAAETDRGVTAHLHAIMGRGYEGQGELDRACDHFSLALTLLEAEDADPFALARAQTNVAAMLIQLDQHDGAGDLLRRAETVQRVIGDRAGLMVTRHNLRLLHIRSSR